MKGLIIITHGSRLESSNKKITKLITNLSLPSEIYHLVSHAFMEMAVPTLFDAVNDQINQDVDTIDVFPLFISQGQHVLADIPKKFLEIQKSFSKIEMHLLPSFGESDLFPKLIIDVLKSYQRFF